MATSAIVKAKRALVILLRSLAALYQVHFSCTRDSSDAEVLRAFRQLALKVHPDRAHQQQINDARRAWDQAKANTKQAAADLVLVQAEGSTKPAAKSKEFRVQAASVLLTYQAFSGLEQWVCLNMFIVNQLKPWRVKHWCTTLEACVDGSSCHAHVMLQFHSSVDMSATAFQFAGVRPNVQPTDLCGEGLCRKKLQISVDRGFFYVWANKIGTVRDPEGNLCVAGNYAPVWTAEKFRYQVLGAWPEKLWKQRKLSTEMYEEYLFLSRDGVVARKRNLDAVKEREESLELADVVAENTKRIRSNPVLYQTFPDIPEVTAWKALFRDDALRYPVLLLLGPSMSGKTEFAHSLFQNALKLHDGIILDDVRDLSFLTENQDKIQGKYNTQLEFGTTPGGQCKYEKYLFRVPVVATLNYSTQNLSYLEHHDWLSKAGNRVVVHFQGFSASSAG